jgi:hypothetical protein
VQKPENSLLKELVNAPPWEWPEDTDRRLLEVLRAESPAEEDLLCAAELAGDLTVMNDEIAAALLDLVRSDSKTDQVRGTAALAFGPALEQADTDGFEDPDDVPISEGAYDTIVNALPRLYNDASVPKQVRRRVLEASVRAPQEWQKDAARAAWASGDDEERLTAVFCMGYVRGFDQEILEALKDKNSDLRYEAICAAAEWPISAAWPVVSSLIASPSSDKKTLLAAIGAVASIRPEQAYEVLAALRDSSDEDVVAAVDEALALAEGMAEAEGFGGEGDDD